MMRMFLLLFIFIYFLFIDRITCIINLIFSILSLHLCRHTAVYSPYGILIHPHKLAAPLVLGLVQAQGIPTDDSSVLDRISKEL